MCVCCTYPVALLFANIRLFAPQIYFFFHFFQMNVMLTMRDCSITLTFTDLNVSTEHGKCDSWPYLTCKRDSSVSRHIWSLASVISTGAINKLPAEVPVSAKCASDFCRLGDWPSSPFRNPMLSCLQGFF